MTHTKTFLFFFHSYGFLSFCAFIFSLGILSQSPFSLEFSSAIALAVFGVYNAHRLLKFHQSKLTIEMNEWLSKNLHAIRSFVVFGLALSCVLFIHLFNLFSLAIFLLGLTLLLSALYSGVFSYFILREIPFIKALLVTISWFIALVFVPKSYTYNFQYLDFSFLILFYALTIPSDLKDIKFDPASFKTIPQLIGSINSIHFFNVLIALFSALNCIYGRLSFLFALSIVLFLVILSLSFLVRPKLIRLELFDISLVVVGLGLLFS